MCGVVRIADRSEKIGVVFILKVIIIRMAIHLQQSFQIVIKSIFYPAIVDGTTMR